MNCQHHNEMSYLIAHIHVYTVTPPHTGVYAQCVNNIVHCYMLIQLHVDVCPDMYTTPAYLQLSGCSLRMESTLIQ